MNTQGAELWRDKPIDSLDEDTLGRANFVRSAAEVIARSWSADEGTVIGLLGPWGSGKTSLINLIEQDLTERFGDWHVAHFTPWSASDEAGVMAEFYAAITAALPEEGRAEFRKAAGELIGLAAPLASFIPYAGEAAKGVAKRASEALSKTKPWNVAFKEASEELQNRGLRILVVVDDVDRLQGPELAEVLKVVRLLGRFPGVQYLLSYDERSVQEALATTALVKDVKAASLFMEKIVQHPLRVPSVGTRARMKLLRREIEKNVAPWEAGGVELAMPRVGSCLPDMARGADTLRTIHRFGASLALEFSRHEPGEVDAEDLVLLSFLDAREPLLFRELPRFSEELRSGKQGEPSYGNGTVQREDFDYIGVFERLAGGVLTGTVQTVLSTLFPALNSSLAGAPAPRVAHADYFDRYFAGGVGVGDVGDGEVARAFEAAARGDLGEIRHLLPASNAWDDDDAVLVFSKFPPPKTLSGKRPVELVDSFSRLIAEIPEQRHFLQSAYERLHLYIESVIVACIEEWDLEDISKATQSAPLRSRLNWAYRLEGVSLKGRERTEGWVEIWLRELAAETARFALSHLRLRDGAPVNGSIWWDFIVAHGDVDAFKVELEKGMAQKDFAAEDLAARFVRAVHVMGAQGTRLEEVDRASWARLAPDEVAAWCAEWETPFVRGPAADHPNTWQARREFARGRLPSPELGTGA